MKDVQDSKKLDKEIQGFPSSLKNSTLTLKQMNCLAVSKGYWPINYETPSFSVPDPFKGVFDEYAKKYA